MSNVLQFPQQNERWLTVNDVCEHYRFGRVWVYAQLKKGMPHRRIEGRVRFRLSEVDAWLGVEDGAA